MEKEIDKKENNPLVPLLFPILPLFLYKKMKMWTNIWDGEWGEKFNKDKSNINPIENSLDISP